MKKIAIFASGNGSNFEAIATAAQKGELDVKITLLICDKPKARVIERAKNHGIKVFSFHPKDYTTKSDYEHQILKALTESNTELIILAGYMRIIGETLLSAYENKIINIHPSLLPAFPGKNAIPRAFESGATETGVTVHYVDAGIDTGQIISQHRVPISPNDTLQTLEAKIHQAEHELYIQTLRRLL